ncbi:MAG: hypothetical protein NZP34_12860, partial [Caldilineales bacterium]|nr:hypothetical protein [Caldilineales bacterium]
FLLLAPVSAQQPLPPLTSYSQDFNSLVASGTGTTANLPTGWTFVEIGANNNITYTANNGSSNIGDTYSYGASGSTERAFGELSSGNLVSTLGVHFQNQTGGTIGKLIIQYYCEQWRRGDGTADVLNFQYSTNATSLTTGTWTDFDTLDCLPTTTAGSNTALDGNANRTLRSGTITGLNIPNNSSVWLRWAAVDSSGFDDGLAIDDFMLNKQTPTAVTVARMTANAVMAPPLWAPAVLFALAFIAARRERRLRNRGNAGQ